MVSDAEIQALARELTRALSKSSMGTGGGTSDSAAPSDRAAKAKSEKILKDNASALEYLKKTLSKNNELLNEANHVHEASSKLFKDAVNSTKSLEGLEKLPDHFKKALDRSNSLFVKKLGENLETLDDMYKGQDKIEKMPQVREFMKDVVNGSKSLDQLRSSVITLGYSTEEANMIVGKFDKNLFNASNGLITNKIAAGHAAEAIDDFDEEVREASQSIVKFSEAADDGEEALTKFKTGVGAVAALLGKELYDAATSSMRLGTELNLFQSRMSGMSPEEFSEMQARNRQSINALTGGFDEFNDIVGESRSEMLLYTGSLKAATELGASLITTSRMMGNAAVDTESFVKSQQNSFKSFNRQLSMTSGEFAAMNERLIQDSDMRAVLYKQSGQQRQAHFEGIQQQIRTYHTWGLLQEQAENLAKAMNKAAGMDAKDRMKLAARQRAVMGALGMGAEGAEAQQIRLKGGRASPEELARLAEINKQFAEAVSAKMGKSFQDELVMQTMLQKAGLSELFGPGGTMQAAVLATGAEERSTNEENTFVGSLNPAFQGLLHGITEGFATLISFLGSPFLAALGTLMLAKLPLGKIFKPISKLLGGAKNFLTGAGGSAARTAAASGGRAAAGLGAGAIASGAMGVAGAGMIGWEIGKAAGDYWEKNDPDSRAEFGDAIGALVDNTLAFLGNEDAQSRVDILDKYEADANKVELENAAKMQELITALIAATQEGNVETQRLINDQIKAMNTQTTVIREQTVTQKESSEKSMEQNKTKQRQAYFAVP